MKNHNINGPKTRPAAPAVFDKNGNQTEASMKYDKIDSEYLTKLLLEHKRNVQLYGNGYPVSNELATAIRIVILKTQGMKSWRKYTDDWKEEMFARAQFCALKYCKSFDPVKMAEKSKNNDPYYYLGQIVSRAFMQVQKAMSIKSKYIKFTSLNENIYHECLNIDEYAGVVQKEAEREKVEISGNISLDLNPSDMDKAVDTLNKIDPDIEVNEDGVDAATVVSDPALRAAQLKLNKKKNAAEKSKAKK